MGLNLETLIGILVILIVLILADGVRRMIKERQGRLRMRIDPRYRDAADQDEDDYAPEVLGSARVVSRRESERLAELENEERADPPIMMDKDEAQAPRAKAEQQPLFAADDGQDDEPVFIHDSPPTPKAAPQPKPQPKPQPRPEPARAASTASQDHEVAERQQPAEPVARKVEKAPPAPRNEPSPRREPQPVVDVIVVHLIARRGEPFPGDHLLELLIDSGLRYGEMNIFHRHVDYRGEDELQFSMANAVEPGTFDLDSMEKNTFAGVTFFLKLPGPTQALAAVDDMFAICRRLATELQGELRDEARSVLTPQTMGHLREKVQEFERRQKLAASK